MQRWKTAGLCVLLAWAIGCGDDSGAADAGDARDDARADGDVPRDADAGDDGEVSCTDPDRDDDGYRNAACGGDDCDDDDPSAHPGGSDFAVARETVSSSTDATRVAAAFDGAGALHAAWIDGGGLHHGVASGGAWSDEVVDPEAASGPSIAFDASGAPHLAWFAPDPDNPARRTLGHGTRSGAAWTVELLRYLEVDDATTSVGFGADGRVLIALRGEGFLDGLRVADNGDGDWVFHGADTDPDSGFGAALVVLPGGAVHVLYRAGDAMGMVLRHAAAPTGAGGVWLREDLEAAADTGRAVAAMAGPSDTLFVAYWGGETTDLRAATLDGAAWRYETVENSMLAGEGVAAGFDAAGHPYVGYQDDPLRLARRSGDGWFAATLEPAGVRDFALAVDAAGATHLVLAADTVQHLTISSPPDGVDQDCDGIADLPCAIRDGDGDGRDNPACGGDDCDDTVAAIHPGAVERPGADDNCDSVYGVDGDGDGFAGLATGGDDCDDAVAAIHPGTLDTPCDGVDQDCSGSDARDYDRDGHEAPACGGDDCGDTDPLTRPGGTEVPCDGIDQDCSGADVTDADGDGYACRGGGGDDCDDADWHTHPGAPDTACDRVDQDCSGTDARDFDRDGYEALACGGPDCDDLAAAAHPGGTEVEPTIEIVDPDAEASAVAIALGPGDTVHIAYYDENGSQMSYAAKSGATWLNEQVARGPATLPWASIAVTPDGEVHLVHPIAAGGLGHSVRHLGTWTTTEIDDNGAYASLAVDPSGRLHVAYIHYEMTVGRRMRYGTFSGGAWAFVTGAFYVLIDSPTDLAVDAAGHAHLGFGRCCYATNAGGAWTAPFCGSGDSPNVALDSGGAAHLLCASPWENMWWAEYVGGAWVTTEIDLPGYDWHEPVGPDLAIGPGDVWHILFEDSRSLTSVYAVGDGTTFATGSVVLGGRGRIAVDDAGVVHVASVGWIDGVSYSRITAPPDGIDQDCDGRVW